MAIAMDTPTVPLTYVSLLRLALPSNKKKQEMKEVEKEKKESSFEDFYCDGGWRWARHRLPVGREHRALREKKMEAA